jgi:uncharacterized protein
MNCPHCNVELRLSERKNIEIDYCPKCRGVWLDRGELDKLVESSNDSFKQSSDSDKHYKHDKYENKHHYKRKSFLGEIFDF